MGGKLPQPFIDSLLDRIDIVDLISSYLSLRKTGKEYIACCPFHNEKTPSFTVSTRKQFYHCFGCGAHGTAIGFLMAYGHMEFIDAIHELASRTGTDIPQAQYASSKRPQDNSGVYRILEQTGRLYHGMLMEQAQSQSARDYLDQRGLGANIRREYQLGYAPEDWHTLGKESGNQQQLQAAGLLTQRDYDRFRHRIMFPIKDHKGRIIGFGGRLLSDGTPKYLNSPETVIFHKGRALYGLYEMCQAMRHIDRILVVEGYMDVLMLAEQGIRYAVATLGTATTSAHIHRLLRLNHEIIFCFDGDRAGRDAAWKALNTALPIMSEGYQIRFMFLPDGEDPDSLIRKEGRTAFEARIAHATHLSDLLFIKIKEGLNLSTIDDRARLAQLARPLITEIPHGLFRQMIVNELSSITGVDKTGLERTLSPADTLRHGTESRTRVRHGAKDRPSLIKQAISLLLQCPDLASEAGNIEYFADLDLRGMPILIKILELLQENPGRSTAGLLEYWRDSPYAEQLALLVTREGLTNREEISHEFQDLIHQLRRRYIDQQIQKLSLKPHPDWQEADRNKMQQLLLAKRELT